LLTNKELKPSEVWINNLKPKVQWLSTKEKLSPKLKLKWKPKKSSLNQESNKLNSNLKPKKSWQIPNLIMNNPSSCKVLNMNKKCKHYVLTKRSYVLKLKVVNSREWWMSLVKTLWSQWPKLDQNNKLNYSVLLVSLDSSWLTVTTQSISLTPLTV